MKMKSGPKIFLFLLFAVVFIGLGYWAGRGFPQTWEGMLPERFTAAQAPVPKDIESRVLALEKEVATLKSILGPAGQVPSSEPFPLSGPPMPGGGPPMPGEVPLAGPDSPGTNAPVVVP